jgi:hypothetical protein
MITESWQGKRKFGKDGIFTHWGGSNDRKEGERIAHDLRDDGYAVKLTGDFYNGVDIWVRLRKKIVLWKRKALKDEISWLGHENGQ